MSKIEALEALEKKASAGDAEAQWQLHLIEKNRLGALDKNKKSQNSRKWLRMAVQSEHPKALISASRKKFGSNKPEDIKQSIDFLTIAAGKGSAVAMGLLGYVHSPNGSFGEGSHKDYETATDWYRKAVEAGGSSISEFSQHLRERDNPARDYDEGLKWLMVAIERGLSNEFDEIELARIYEKGNEVPRNYSLALKYFFKSLKHNKLNMAYEAFALANYKIGYYHEYGLGVEKNVATAIEHYDRVVRHKYAKTKSFRSKYSSAAFYRLGQLLLRTVKPVEVTRGRKLIAIAASQGSSEARRLARYFEAKDRNLAKEDVEKFQVNLTSLGYKPGAIDGNFNEKTYDAIRAFQCSANLHVNGQPTNLLLRALNATTNSSIRTMYGKNLDRKLESAIKKLDLDCVSGALALGANPNVSKGRLGVFSFMDLQESTVLEKQDQNTVKAKISSILFSYGARAKRGDSALFFAVLEGNLDYLKVLIKAGYDPHIKIDKKLPVVWSAYYQQDEIYRFLVDSGAIPLSKEEIAQEQLINSKPASSASGILRMEKALADGAKIHRAAVGGSTVFGASIRRGIFGKGSYKRIKYLLENGADPNQNFSSGFRNVEGIPLQVFVMMNAASMNGKLKNPRSKLVKKYATDALMLLIEHGAKIASRDDNGLTPLHWAAKKDNVAAAKILLEAGALSSHRDKKDALPIDYAESSQMISLLKNYRHNTKRENVPTGPSFGSGFRITGLGHFVTNAHIVEKCRQIEVGDNSSEMHLAELVSLDKDTDLALLQKVAKRGGDSKSIVKKTGIHISSKTSGNGELRIAGELRSYDIQLGETVIVSGFPYGDFISSSVKITSGIASSIRGFGDNNDQFQLDAAVQPGNSGGPIYDSSGNIVGVVVSRIDKQKMAKIVGSMPENSNFGIKASVIKQFLEASGLPIQLTNKKLPKSTDLVAKIAQRQTVMVSCTQ